MEWNFARIPTPGVQDRDFKFWTRSKNSLNPEFPGILDPRHRNFSWDGKARQKVTSTDEHEFFIPFLTREASIQLVYQLCVVIQQFLYFPVKDLTVKPMIYAQSNGASIQWIFGLIFQVVSIFTSAFSAINLPLKVKYLNFLTPVAKHNFSLQPFIVRLIKFIMLG